MTIDKAFLDSIRRDAEAAGRRTGRPVDGATVAMLVEYFGLPDADRAAINDPAAPLPRHVKHGAALRAVAAAQATGRQRFRAALTARAAAMHGATNYTAMWARALAAPTITSVVTPR